MSKVPAEFKALFEDGLEHLTPREMWDLIDGIYLKHEMKIEDLMGMLGLEQEEFLRLRKNNLPVPIESVEAFLKGPLVKG